MVDVAEEAIKVSNYSLATEIYETAIRELGPSADSYIKLGNVLCLAGKVSEAFTSFLKAYRLSHVSSDKLTHLVNSLVRLTRDSMMNAANAHNGGEACTMAAQSNNGDNDMDILALNTKELIESEPFLCGVCLGTVQEPTTIYCGHTFCRKCLDKQDSNVCIVCGQNPRLTDGYRPNVLMSEIVKKLFPKLDQLHQLKSEANTVFSQGRLEEACQRYTTILSLCMYYVAYHSYFSNIGQSLMCQLHSVLLVVP